LPPGGNHDEFHLAHVIFIYRKGVNVGLERGHGEHPLRQDPIPRLWIGAAVADHSIMGPTSRRVKWVADPARGFARARALRASIGVIACVVLPAASWLEGSATFAWTMYSRAGEFCIDLIAFDAAGNPRQRNPTLLALHAGPGAASLLAGSDHWRQGPSMALLRHHLDELARHACSETGAAAIEVTLRERVLGGAERATTRRARCAP
jgi:hypothetical protein